MKAKKQAKTPHCEIVVVLDRSGSMATIQKDMEGGYNAFIAEQKNGVGTCNVTLVQFDTNAIETVYEAKPVNDVPNLVFIPRGGTPLLDAIGKTLADTQARIKNADTKVVFVVITDGEENSSKEWTREKIKAQIEARTKDGWLFQFLGANVDSFSEASSLGIWKGSTMDYSPSKFGVHNMYAASAGSISTFRSSTSTGEELLKESAFTDEDREKAKTI